MLDAKTIAALQSEANRNAAKRSGKSGVRLLDDAENNVGNATILQPQILPPGQDFTVVKQSNPPRVLNLTADSKSGQSVTVVMTAARQTNAIGHSGPVTGIIEFGNGTQFTRVEFDVPIGPYTGNASGVTPGTQPDDSGAVIQVPTGIVRSYFRYDNAYITPELEGFAFGGPGSPAFPLPAGAGPFAPGGSAPLVVKAFANYFGRHHTPLYKSLYLFIGNAIAVQFGASGAPNDYSIPPFAKSIQIVRVPDTSAMTLVLNDQIINETYNIPSGPSPIIPITGNQNTFLLYSNSPADTVVKVKAVFEIGF
jgi:hypothetical protein